jgi:DNA-directed RNA polymerase beta' subunit
MMARELALLRRGRDRLRKVFVRGGEVANIYAPVKLERIVTQVRNKALRVESADKLHPVDIFLGVEAALDEMAPTRFIRDFQALRNERLRYPQLQIKQRREFEDRLHELECECGVELIRILIRLQLASKIVVGMKLTPDLFKEILEEIKIRYKQALVKAGEPIGAIAAQSVGEPTTQMTLNTFHLAGVSENNVTLGVPRIQ